MQGGYAGKILRVNLTEKTSATEELPEQIAKNYIGGAGLSIKYMYDEVDPAVDPFSSNNKLIFAVGPLTGTDAPGVSRLTVASKSPNGSIATASSGGFFPTELKLAGYDMIIVEGKAEEPVYLWIKDNKVTFRDASGVWGTDTFDCQTIIKDQLRDQNIRIACIGQAGENLSNMAAVINEKHAAARKGLGAVMGSKNLKAVAVRGSGKVKVVDKERFKKACAEIHRAIRESPMAAAMGGGNLFAMFGSSLSIELTSAVGFLPMKNYAESGEHDFLDDLGTDVIATRRIGHDACPKCPLGCCQTMVAKDPPYTGIASGPEYESIFALGPATMNRSFDAIIAADNLCDRLGLDTISTGMTIAFAMELMERGIITKEDTDGIDLSFGNHEAMVEFVRRIGHRQGFGDILANGVKKAAEIIRKGSEKYAMHVKGLELPAYDVRGGPAHGLSYATAYPGADHNKGYAMQEVAAAKYPYPVDRFAFEGKGKLTQWNQNSRLATADSAPMCIFMLDAGAGDQAQELTAELLSGATGLDFTPESVFEVGERATAVAKLFNLKAGLTRADDDLPERLKTEPIKEGIAEGAVIPQKEFDGMLDEYYEARGWTKEGVPTEETLVRLGIV